MTKALDPTVFLRSRDDNAPNTAAQAKEALRAALAMLAAFKRISEEVVHWERGLSSPPESRRDWLEEILSVRDRFAACAGWKARAPSDALPLRCALVAELAPSLAMLATTMAELAATMAQLARTTAITPATTAELVALVAELIGKKEMVPTPP